MLLPSFEHLLAMSLDDLLSRNIHIHVLSVFLQNFVGVGPGVFRLLTTLDGGFTRFNARTKVVVGDGYLDSEVFVSAIWLVVLWYM